MIADTAMVNFGISKISSVIDKATPMLQSVGAKYVHYIVVKTVLLMPIMFIAFTSMVLIALFFYNKATEDFEEHIAWTIGMIFGIIISLVLFGCFIESVYSMTLALWCPEMFTIDQIIQAAKSK